MRLAHTSFEEQGDVFSLVWPFTRAVETEGVNGLEQQSSIMTIIQSNSFIANFVQGGISIRT